MAKLSVKYKGNDTSVVELDNVVDAGIANDFLVIRYQDGVVTFTRTDKIDDVQFDPTADQEDTGTTVGEGENDTSDQ